MSKPTDPKREQPRSDNGQFGSLPTRQPQIPTARVTLQSIKPVEASGEANDKLADIYSKFKAKHGRAPVIGLDLDGTTANMVGGFRLLMAEKNGLSTEDAHATLREPDKYNMWTGEAAWFTTKEEFIATFQGAEKGGLYRTLPAYEGAKEVIDSLIESGFEVKAVTARSEEYNSDTAHWISSQDIPVDEILHPGHLKHDVEGIDIFFDDAPHVISGLVEHDHKVVIFDRAWNENEAVDEPNHTRRVHGWGIEGITSALEDLL